MSVLKSRDVNFRAQLLTQKLLKQGYIATWLMSLKYKLVYYSINQMAMDIFPFLQIIFLSQIADKTLSGLDEELDSGCVRRNWNCSFFANLGLPFTPGFWVWSMLLIFLVFCVMVCLRSVSCVCGLFILDYSFGILERFFRQKS